MHQGNKVAVSSLRTTHYIRKYDIQFFNTTIVKFAFVSRRKGKKCCILIP